MSVAPSAVPDEPAAPSAAQLEDNTKESGDEYRFQYTPSLDGLRAVSILLVLGFHGMGRISGTAARVLAGWSGVDIFFVISGFLITSLLLQEKKDLGSFSLKRFYVRRCLRIWPAYYLFLLVTALAGLSSLASVTVGAVYLTNYDVALGWQRSRGLEHLWSLAVEEQFYLVWPITLYVAGRRAIPVAAGLIALVWGWRIALLLHGVPWVRLTGAFDTRLDCLLLGCLAALLWAHPQHRARVRASLAGVGMPVIVTAALFCSAQTLGHPSAPALETRLLFWLVRLPIFTTLTALLILTLLVHPGSAVARLLGHPILVWVGRLSYSLYLWHGVAFSLWSPAGRYLPHAQEVGRLLSGLLLASASYYLVERPFLALKKRWAPELRRKATPAGSAAPAWGDSNRAAA